MFRKLELSPSSGKGGGDAYCVGFLRKSYPQLVDNPCHYNYNYINT
jgi:hypothetical protein